MVDETDLFWVQESVFICIHGSKTFKSDVLPWWELIGSGLEQNLGHGCHWWVDFWDHVDDLKVRGQ